MMTAPWMLACSGVLGVVAVWAVVTLGRWAWARAMEPLREPVRFEGLPVVVGSMEVNDERYVQREEVAAIVRDLVRAQLEIVAASSTADVLQWIKREAERTAPRDMPPVHIPNPKDQPSLADIERGARR